MTNVKTCVDDLNNGLPSIELSERRNSMSMPCFIQHVDQASFCVPIYAVMNCVNQFRLYIYHINR